MSRIMSFFMLFVLLAIAATAQTNREKPSMDFESYDPVSTLVVPENPVSRAKFPFIDVHSHQFRMATQNLDDLARIMDTLNMQVMVNLSGRGGEQLKLMMENVKKNQPKRFIVFTNINFEGVGTQGWTENAVAQLEEDVRNGAAGLKIYKSLGFSVKDDRGERVAVDDVRLDPIWKKCGELGIPVLIHTADPKSFWDPMDEKNERWLELATHPGRKRGPENPVPFDTLIAEQHRMFRKHPGTTFIAAHFGWYPNDLAKLSGLMESMPNMYVEFGAVIAELGRQPRMAKEFFEKYQDRILFGKDSWVPGEYATYFRVLETKDEYFPYHKKYHAFWAMYGMDLSDEVLKKIYYKNAIKIIPGIDETMFPK